MDFDEEKGSEIMPRLINDENNNFRNSSCTNCDYGNPFEEKRTDRMIIVPDLSSDEEYYCSSCSSEHDSELISLDPRQLWHDIAHLIKCIYRETNREFAENHSTNDICKAKEYVQILTQSNPESLFNKVESIVLEYVDEIRNQVLKRSQTYLKSSNDVQLFISYLLDEYNTFIQAAKNISTIVSYLEEHYMKSFHLTWLFYNKHLYEKLVYMDKKIQHAMSIMIDLLQPSNENNNDYSPAEYKQLLNRFLAFDEEMSEIAYLYKDCQAKMSSISRNSTRDNRNQVGVLVKKTKKKICKKPKRVRSKQGTTKDNFNGSSTTNAVNIPIAINSATIPAVLQQDSNGSSIGKESSSISSFDEYSLGNNTSASSYTKDESDHVYPDVLNTLPTATFELDHKEEKPKTEPPTIEEEQTANISTTKTPKSTRRKENLNPSKTSLTPDLIRPPKPPAKLQADFGPLTIPFLRKTEIPACPSLLSAKIQSVSFTAGTFGSITTAESSMNRAHLNLSLSKRTDSKMALNNLDQLLRQAASPNEISAFLSSLEPIKTTEELFRDKNRDLCCCDLFPESNATTPNYCGACMSLSNPTTITCAFNQRDAETNKRLQLKLTKRPIQTPVDQPKSSPSAGNKSKSKPCDNNIDDLVRFIDGDEATVTESTSKKNKKKKEKQKKFTSRVDPSPPLPPPQPSPKRKQKGKSKTEEPIDQPSASKPPTLPVTTSPPEKTESKPKKIERSVENPVSAEEEVNWITISRKQSKHKPTSIPSLLAAPVAPPNNNSKQNRQQTTGKSRPSNTQSNAQPKVIPETVTNSNKQHPTTASRPQSAVKSQSSQPHKVETPSPWTNHERARNIPVASTSTLLATAPAFVPSSSFSIPIQKNDSLPVEQPVSSLYWDPNGYLFPPGPVQRPTASFSPAPGPRCIRRPSTESSNNSFPSYSPLNYTVGNSTSTWNDPSERYADDSQWKYPYEKQSPTSTSPNDFPLYDPFNSGTGLTIPPSSLLTNGFEVADDHLHIPRENDVDEMDALEKEIEDFKKCYIDNLPFDSRDKRPGNIDSRFSRQS